MSERWLAIPGYEGRYAVSDHGNVMSMDFAGSGLPGILKKHLARGYFSVAFYPQPRKVKRYTIHRLVMLAFVGPRPDGMQINHKNGIKTDNRLENLEYCTASQNMKHAHATGLQSNRGERHSRSKLTNEVVRGIVVRLSNGESPRSIAKDVGVDVTNVYHIRSGRIWSSVTGRKEG